jgi:hypothetical protein
MENNILIHDSSGVYNRFINDKFEECKNIFFVSKIDEMDGVDFNKFSLIIVFVNDVNDLFDFAYLNSKPIKKIVGCGNSLFYKKLLFFPDIELFNLFTPKESLLVLLKKYINKYSLAY